MELTSHMVAGVLPSLPISICWGTVIPTDKKQVFLSRPCSQAGSPGEELRRTLAEERGRYGRPPSQF